MEVIINCVTLYQNGVINTINVTIDGISRTCAKKGLVDYIENLQNHGYDIDIKTSQGRKVDIINNEFFESVGPKRNLKDLEEMICQNG